MDSEQETRMHMNSLVWLTGLFNRDLLIKKVNGMSQDCCDHTREVFDDVIDGLLVKYKPKKIISNRDLKEVAKYLRNEKQSESAEYLEFSLRLKDFALQNAYILCAG